MAIELPQELEDRAQAHVALGAYPNVVEVVRAALDALDERDEAAEEWLEHAGSRFRQGLEAEARDEAVEIAPRDLMARIRARVEKAV